jgi:ABC-type transporter Mla subunit MlaD
METWQVALLTVSALLVGALVPAIIQFQIALKTLARAIDRTSERLDRTLARAETILGTVEKRSGEIDAFLGAIGSVSDSLEKAKTTLASVSQLGAALVPALSAAVSAVLHDGEPAGPRAELAVLPERKES